MICTMLIWFIANEELHCYHQHLSPSSLYGYDYWLHKRTICSKRLIQCLDLNANYQIKMTRLHLKPYKYRLAIQSLS